jgi:hypothetical protein
MVREPLSPSLTDGRKIAQVFLQPTCRWQKKEVDMADKDDIARAKKQGIEDGESGDDSSTLFDDPEEAAARTEGNALGKIAHNTDEDDD